MTSINGYSPYTGAQSMYASLTGTKTSAKQSGSSASSRDVVAEFLNYQKMTPEQKQAFIDRAGFDSELKTVMAGYIKAMSGAAVSDEERKFYESAILGGNWSNKEAALASMKGFITGGGRNEGCGEAGD